MPAVRSMRLGPERQRAPACTWSVRPARVPAARRSCRFVTPLPSEVSAGVRRPGPGGGARRHRGGRDLAAEERDAGHDGSASSRPRSRDRRWSRSAVVDWTLSDRAVGWVGVRRASERRSVGRRNDRRRRRPAPCSEARYWIAHAVAEAVGAVVGPSAPAEPSATSASSGLTSGERESAAVEGVCHAWVPSSENARLAGQGRFARWRPGRDPAGCAHDVSTSSAATSRCASAASCRR